MFCPNFVSFPVYTTAPNLKMGLFLELRKFGVLELSDLQKQVLRRETDVDGVVQTKTSLEGKVVGTEHQNGRCSYQEDRRKSRAKWSSVSVGVRRENCFGSESREMD